MTSALQLQSARCLMPSATIKGRPSRHSFDDKKWDRTGNFWLSLVLSSKYSIIFCIRKEQGSGSESQLVVLLVHTVCFEAVARAIAETVTVQVEQPIEEIRPFGYRGEHR